MLDHGLHNKENKNPLDLEFYMPIAPNFVIGFISEKGLIEYAQMYEQARLEKKLSKTSPKSQLRKKTEIQIDLSIKNISTKRHIYADAAFIKFFNLRQLDHTQEYVVTYDDKRDDLKKILENEPILKAPIEYKPENIVYEFTT